MLEQEAAREGLPESKTAPQSAGWGVHSIPSARTLGTYATCRDHTTVGNTAPADPGQNKYKADTGRGRERPAELKTGSKEGVGSEDGEGSVRKPGGEWAQTKEWELCSKEIETLNMQECDQRWWEGKAVEHSTKRPAGIPREATVA